MKAPSAPRRRARREDRIEAILQAAQDVFLDQGYEATTLDLIARRAKASKATIYAHFRDKLGLFEAILAAHIKNTQVPLHEAGHTAADALRRFGSAFLTLMLSPPVLAFYRMIVSRGVEMPELAKLWYANGPRRMIAGVAAFLAERTRSGELDVANPDLAAEFFLMSLRGTLHLQAVAGLIRGPFEPAIAEKVNAAVEMFLRAYARPTAQPRRRSRP
jgi:TetR/AcrR family transcriptional repressor of mexJK operon